MCKADLHLSSGLEAIVKNHVFVGVADLQGSLSMLQHHQKLFLINHASLSFVISASHSGTCH
jgi:hypothetical protein